MIFIEALRSGWQAILANRLRSILTTLGIMIGCLLYTSPSPRD